MLFLIWAIGPKVFKVIERFSEDIDLILNWNEITQEDPYDERSRTQQDKFNKEIIEKGKKYLRDRMLPEISSLLDDCCEANIPDDMPEVINIRYAAAFSEDYLRAEIRLEIGPFALWCPNATFNILAYAAEEFPDLFEKPVCQVQVVTAERTFWEKATILHREAHRPPDKIQPARYSRHYYDVARMAMSPIKGSALQQLDLLKDVGEFKDKFYPCGWARYDLAVPGSFKLVPPDYLMDTLQKDYREMGIMIYGHTPDFSEIIQTLSELEAEINQSQST